MNKSGKQNFINHLTKLKTFFWSTKEYGRARSEINYVDYSSCSFIPESCRWLLTHGKFEEIRVILKRLAKWNKRVEPDLSILDEIIAKELDIIQKKKKYTYFSLLKFKSTRLKILLCSYMW